MILNEWLKAVSLIEKLLFSITIFTEYGSDWQPAKLFLGMVQG
jgi:hypothetical protein